MPQQAALEQSYKHHELNNLVAVIVLQIPNGVFSLINWS